MKREAVNREAHNLKVFSERFFTLSLIPRNNGHRFRQYDWAIRKAAHPRHGQQQAAALLGGPSNF